MNPIYSIREFFRDIKNVINSLENKKINYHFLSTNYLMKKSKWYINDLILKSKRNHDYFLSTQTLNSFTKALKLKLKENFDKLNRYFIKYHNFYSGQYNQENLNLIDNYFQNIDIKEKAYWYGWLLAEGHVRMHRRKYELSVEIGVKDGILIKRFIQAIGLSPRNVDFTRKPPNEFSLNYTYTFSFRISGNLFGKYLYNHGFPIGKKSNLIRLPSFNNNKLSMSCLLGFFDGDGTHSGGTPRIGTIKSKRFLEDIVHEFELKKVPKLHFSNNKLIGYYLTLGGKLFNKLLDNYENSLERKRLRYKSSSWAGLKRRKMMWTKLQLKNIILQNPNTRIEDLVKLHFKTFKISIAKGTLNNYLSKWNIKLKPEAFLIKDTRYKRSKDLLRNGVSLYTIYSKEFGLKGFEKHAANFFKNLFITDPLVKNTIKKLNSKYEIFNLLRKVYGPKNQNF